MTEHISVCICTYRRPNSLLKSLDSLQNQIVNDKFTLGIVVVDNDRHKSAEEVIERYQSRAKVRLEYYIEPERNIALARNMSLRKADGEYIAGIDDDEIADPKWLLNMYQTIKEYRADAVLGPVIPRFGPNAPKWAIEGGFYERKSLLTGTIIDNSKETRTGNFLLDNRIVRHEAQPFNPIYGQTGGEDTDFFRRLIERGIRLVSCQEAYVYEEVPDHRMKRTYLVRRALLRGEAAASNASLLSADTLKSLAAILAYGIAIPTVSWLSKYQPLRLFIKLCDHFGKVMRRLGIRLVKMTEWDNLERKDVAKK